MVRNVASVLPLWVALGLFLAGCRARPASQIELPEDVTRYAVLPGLHATHHAALRAELARLISEEATPLQLMGRPARGGSPASTSQQAEVGDVPPASWERVFSAGDLAVASKQVDRLCAVRNHGWDGDLLQAAMGLRTTYDSQRRGFRQLVAQEDLAVRLQHDRGMAADTSFVEVARVASRLESFLVAETLANGSPTLAIEPLTWMLRTAEALARVKHVTSRVAAVHVRAEGLTATAAIANHPAAKRPDNRQLADLLAGQLQKWPQDESPWIGERAQGLHTYELVRDGYLLSLVTPQDILPYRAGGGLETWSKKVVQNIDEDEWFYLRTARRLIESCQRPFAERAGLFLQIETDLERLRDSSSHPFVADRILFTQWQEVQRLQALDRARCEAWKLALGLAGGETPGEIPENPLTGDRYVIRQDSAQVTVDGIDPERGEPPVVLAVRPDG